MYCADALLAMDAGAFQTMVKSVIFGCKHEKTEVMDLSLQILEDLLKKMASAQPVCTEFFKAFYVELIQELLGMMTDCRHLAGFK